MQLLLILLTHYQDFILLIALGHNWKKIVSGKSYNHKNIIPAPLPYPVAIAAFTGPNSSSCKE